MKEKEKKVKLTVKEKKQFYICVTVLIICLIVSVIMMLPAENMEEPLLVAEFSDVDKICELATLRCFYHDVAEYEKQPEGLFQYGLFQYGYKKFWLEYNGIVKVGVDINQVWVGEPDANGLVCVFVPEATILEIDVDPYSMSDIVMDTGVLTSITTEEKAQAFSEAQVTMRQNAETDQSLLVRARNNAKELLENYIVGVGKAINQKYIVKFVDSPQI